MLSTKFGKRTVNSLTLTAPGWLGHVTLTSPIRVWDEISSGTLSAYPGNVAVSVTEAAVTQSFSRSCWHYNFDQYLLHARPLT